MSKPMRSKKPVEAEAGKARVQFDFSRESLQKLDELVATLNVATRADVIRRALSLFTTIINETSEGSKVLIEKPDGKLREIVLL